MNTYTIFAFLAIVCAKSLAVDPACEVFRSNPNATLAQTVSSKMVSLWSRLKLGLLGQDSLISRCFGAAKGLRVAMPLIIFKLGVIVTMVAFVAVFSLKGLGLMVTLLMLNFSGFFHKLTAAKEGHHHEYKRPQNVHVHVHNKGGGGWHPAHHHDGWSDRNVVGLDGFNDVGGGDGSSLTRRLGLDAYDD